jgi:hypothetical protein
LRWSNRHKDKAAAHNRFGPLGVTTRLAFDSGAEDVGHIMQKHDDGTNMAIVNQVGAEDENNGYSVVNMHLDLCAVNIGSHEGVAVIGST